MLTIEKQIEIILLETVNNLYPDKDLKPIEITVATNEKFGDFQSNFAMMNSKIIGGNPRAIAENVVNNIVENSVIDKIEIAGPGFLNIFLKDSYLGDLVKKISKEDYEFKGLNI
ncbi:MAG: arginine--tRNA ligase, partial [Cetobacterium sp.]